MAYFLALLLGLTLASTAAVGEDDTLVVALVAPGEKEHFAWAAATRLQHATRGLGIDVVVEQAPWTGSAESHPDLFVMPVRSLATLIPDLQVLELPFFYPSLEAVHRVLDGSLGAVLARAARASGWEILAYWDGGMHALSGLKRYDRVRNLKAREFLFTRPDPVAEKQFGYWKADVRRIKAQSQADVLRECVIASRATTLQEIMREQLFRVHLAISLSNHRYEGWVVVAPRERWVRIDEGKRKMLVLVLREITAWQRCNTRDREAAALTALKRAGMTIHDVDASEREAFRSALPDWVALLPDELTAEKKRELIMLASFGTTAVTGPRDVAAPADTCRDPLPSPNGR